LGAGKEKGFLLIGAIFSLQLKGKLVYYDKLIGVSVGGLIATLINLELTFDQLYKEAINFNIFESFRDFSFDAKEGLFSPAKIRQRVDFWMKLKFGKLVNFLELHNMTGKHLILVATDQRDPEDPKPVYFDYLTTPFYSVSKAVVESCLIPGFFETNSYQFIDGVFSDPFPIEKVDTGDEGAKVDAFLLKDKYPADSNKIVNSIQSIFSALDIPTKILIQTKMKNLSKNVRVIILLRIIKEWNWKNATGVYLTFEEKKKLVLDGANQTWDAFAHIG
jgi:predicted acylesterase/phospholipase RssA